MKNPAPAGADVVVVGGGVIGLSVAESLASRGADVLVLDLGPVPGVASPVAAGMLAPISEAEVEEPELLPFAFASFDLYPSYVAHLEEISGVRCHLRCEGTLWIAVHRDDAEALEHLRGTLEERGLPAEPVDDREVRAREPHLSPRVLGGLWVERDHQVAPHALLAALRGALERQGGRLVSGARVTAVEERDGAVRRVRWESAQGAHETSARRVVLAAGAWTTAEIQSPARHLAVRPVKGQILRLRGPEILRHVLRHPEVYLVPKHGGEIVVGATMEEVGFDAEPTGGGIHDLLRKALQVLPGLYDHHWVEARAGFRPMRREGSPAVGPTEVDGLFVATGHGRHGILLAPATGHYLAEAMVSGSVPDVLRPLVPAPAAG